MLGYLQLDSLFSMVRSEVKRKVDFDSGNHCFITAREQLQNLESAGLRFWLSIVYIEGAWELERLIYGDVLKICLAYRTLYLVLLGLDRVLLASLQPHLKGEGLIRVHFDIEWLHHCVKDYFVLADSLEAFEHLAFSFNAGALATKFY